MRSTVRAAMLALTLAAPLGVAPASAADCPRPQDLPLKTEGRTPVFQDACGQRFQAGYRLQGATLHFPGGGTHTIREATEAEAERVLRDAYGLVGPRDRLVRTAWPED